MMTTMQSDLGVIFEDPSKLVASQTSKSHMLDISLLKLTSVCTPQSNVR